MGVASPDIVLATLMKKRVIVLGSTGSIGQQSLSVLRPMPDQFQVVGLAAGSRLDILAEQANRYRPEAIALARLGEASTLDASLDYSPRILNGGNALRDLVDQVPCDCVISAVVGTGGLAATLRATELGRRIALANKEAMVIAGSLLMPLAQNSGATIIPVDSEHSAVFQAMHAGRREEVRRVYLTASGGPFLDLDPAALRDVTVEDALKHPTWEMGPKISIDSATMMNKALEIVEARWLFDLNADQIEVIVHPESIVHSLVEFCDGSIVAQLSRPDMRTPIQYALTYPQRKPCAVEPLDLKQLGRLRFQAPDEERFPALRLGYEAARRGGTAGAVLNAANEAAVELFRKGELHFPDIARVTGQALAEHPFHPAPTMEDLLAADRWARQEVDKCLTC
jgi:1-deoxy-D-xylulose-5-phosphate reductoisomerase